MSERTPGEDALALVTQLRDRINELEEQLDHERQRRKELEAELQAVDERTELLQDIGGAAATPYETRAAILIQTLYRDARSNERAGQRPHAAVTVSEAVDIFQRDVSRAVFYGDDGVFQTAEDLVGDTDVLEYVKESRSSGQNTRLKLRLDGGELPATIAGKRITEGEA